MDSLIVASLEGTATPEEEQAIKEWRAADSGNERRYQEIARVWRLVPGVYPTNAPARAPDPADLIARAGVRRFPTWRSAPRRAWRRASVIFVGGVAAAAAVIGLSLGLWQYAAQRIQPGFGAQEFVTGRAEMSTVRLRDGSVVRLAPNTKLRLTGRGRDREVTLSGHAFFAIAKANGNPFRVKTSAGEVTVLGTRFDLQAEAEDLNLVVIEGNVRLSTVTSAEIPVSAGEMTRVVQGTPTPVVRLPDASRTIEWIGDLLVFQSTPLRDAAQEIEDRFGVDVVISDPSLAERTVTAYLADRPLDEVVRIVCAALLAECQVRDGVVTVEPTTGTVR